MTAVADPVWLAALIASLMATGLVAGLLAGLLGVGGGIVIVPVLFHIFPMLDVDPSVRMHVAVGTSLATIIPTSLMSARGHFKKGAIDLDLVKSWGPALAAGVLTGAILAGFVKGWILTAIFALAAMLVAANMAFRPEGYALAADLPKRPWRDLMAGTIGLISTLMGIGGGTLTVPTLSLFSYPIRRAVATASLIGAIISIPGAIGFLWAGLDAPNRPPFSLGYINLAGFALIVPMTLLAAPWGVKIAHAINPAALRRAFAFFLFLTSLRMFWGLMG